MNQIQHRQCSRKFRIVSGDEFFMAKIPDVNSQALRMVTFVFKQGLQLPKDSTPTSSFQAKYSFLTAATTSLCPTYVLQCASASPYNFLDNSLLCHNFFALKYGRSLLRHNSFGNHFNILSLLRSYNNRAQRTFH